MHASFYILSRISRLGVYSPASFGKFFCKGAYTSLVCVSCKVSVIHKVTATHLCHQ